MGRIYFKRSLPEPNPCDSLRDMGNKLKLMHYVETGNGIWETKENVGFSYENVLD